MFIPHSIYPSLSFLNYSKQILHSLVRSRIWVFQVIDIALIISQNIYLLLLVIHILVARNHLPGKRHEISLSHGLKKTIARFHVNNFGTLPNGRPIGIHRLKHTSIRHKHVPLQPGEKAVRIRYYKGRAYHRVSARTACVYTLHPIRWFNFSRWFNCLEKCEEFNNTDLIGFTYLKYVSVGFQKKITYNYVCLRRPYAVINFHNQSELRNAMGVAFK